MTLSITPAKTGGSIPAIASKSEAHRLLILSAFADKPCRIRCEELNDDISATVGCLCAMGATIVRDGSYFHITPIASPVKQPLLDCKESGSTLRFLVPVAAMLGLDASFLMAGRLPERPLSPLREELERCGATLSETGTNPLLCKGRLQKTEFSIPANVSSQFISGLLFALAVSGQSGSVELIGRQESVPYVDMTLDALALFGIRAEREGSTILIRENRGIVAPDELRVGGDWSGAAFPLCLGAVGASPVTVEGLDPHTRQGDRAVLDALRLFGADVVEREDRVTVSPAPLHGIDLDASQIPDLVPVLAVVAAGAVGTTVISGAARLRIKESDRLMAVRQMINVLGGEVIETSDGLIVHGTGALTGGSVSSHGDHRIAMSAAVASVLCREEILLEGAESVSKSYPRFWQDAKILGMKLTESGKEN